MTINCSHNQVGDFHKQLWGISIILDTVTARRLANALGADFGFYEIDTTGKVLPVKPAASAKAA